MFLVLQHAINFTLALQIVVCYVVKEYERLRKNKLT